jgi:integrase
VSRAITDYLSWMEKHKRSAAVSRYKAKAHILPTLGDVPVEELTTARIRRWLDSIAEAPARLRTGKGKAQKHREAPGDDNAKRARRATANRSFTVLRGALNMAWRERKVASDAAWRPVKPLPRVDARRDRYLSADECRRLLNACSVDFRNIVRAALLTGARYGELCRALVRDVDLEAGALHIPESKSGKDRWIPLDGDGLAFFRAAIIGRDKGARLFLKNNGRPWGAAHQARPLAEANAAAKLDPSVTFHGLRHTWASHRVMQGAPLIVVAQVLGHSDTRMVEKHYGHLAPSYVRDVIKNTALGIGSGVDTNVVPLTGAP